MSGGAAAASQATAFLEEVLARRADTNQLFRGGVCRGRPHDHSRRGLPSFARNEHRQQANNMSSPPYGL